MNKRALTIGVLITALIANSQAFAAQFLFTPQASVYETYTDNLFLTNNDTDDDFITTLSAGFAMQLLGRTSGLDFSFDPNYTFYNDFSEFDQWGLISDLRAWVSPSKFSNLELRNNFNRTTDPIGRGDRRGDRVVVEGGRVEERGDTTLRVGREPYSRNRARLNYSQRFGREDRVYAGLRYGFLRNDSNQVEDNQFYRLNAGLDYWFTYRFGGEFFGEYTRGEYDQPSGFVGEGASDFDNYVGTFRFRGRMSRHFSLFFQYDQAYRDFTSGIANNYIVYAPSAGFDYEISDDTFLRLGLGYYYQDTENEKNNGNIFFNGELSKRWSYQRGLINLRGIAGLTQNDFGAQNLGFQQRVAVEASALYDFTRRIFGDVNAYYRLSFTPGRTEDVGDQQDQTDHRAQFNVGIGFLPTRWMILRLGYTFNYYNSNVDQDYYENRALLTITLQPDRPWRF